MIIEIPFKTPTVNQMYSTFKGRRIKSKEARKKAEDVAKLLMGIKHDILPSHKLSVTIQVYGNWINKDGSIKIRDVANYEKFIIDSVFSALKINDCQIFEITMRKIQGEDMAKVIIEKDLTEFNEFLENYVREN